MFGSVSFLACGSSVQQGLVIWSESNQILLDVGSEDGIGVGDKATIHRETQLTHPASGEYLGMLEEELTDASIIAVREDTATAKLVGDALRSVPLTIQPGDKAIVTEQKDAQTTNFVTEIGAVISIEPQSQSIEITIQNPNEIYPGATLTVAMPKKIIQHPVSGDKIAILMRKIADVEVIAVDSTSNTANCRISESNGSPEIGDIVVKLPETSISSWFQEMDEYSEEMIYRRAYRQALKHYESAEYWQVIRNLKTIESLNIGFEDTLYLLAASYKHLGIYDKAQNYFERAMRQKPDDAKIWLELAYMYLDQNRLKEAADAYQQITKLFPNNFQFWIDLSNIYSRMGDQAKRNAAYQKAAQLEPNNEEVKY
ncbi:tetratricopeptide repeat protein [bacterium]|nr:tetratricopeptide repeat protein [bacterium]